MKTKMFIATAVMLMLAGGISCKNKMNDVEEKQIHKIDENLDSLICDVNDPLQDIEWLKEFCESLNDAHDFSRVRIYLYKVVGSGEYLFLINIVYLPEDSPCHSSLYWKNCSGKTIFGVSSCVPPMPGVVENFIKDKELVAELFDYVMPLCGVNNPLQNIKWLKEYCDSLNEKQDISSVRINLIRSKDEYFFQIFTFFPFEYEPNKWTEYFSEVWKNCAGEEINYSNDYMNITELFNFVNQ
jgi:hypothetical protein